MAPNKVAQVLGQRRMESMSEEELRAFQSAAGKASADSLTAEQRKARAKAASVTRWSKARKKAAKKGKKAVERKTK